MGDYCRRFAEAGAWMRPMGKVVYLTLAFVTSDAELDLLTGAMRSVV